MQTLSKFLLFQDGVAMLAHLTLELVEEGHRRDVLEEASAHLAPATSNDDNQQRMPVTTTHSLITNSAQLLGLSNICEC